MPVTLSIGELREKKETLSKSMASSCNTVVEHLTSHPKVEGLSPEKKKLLTASIQTNSTILHI